MTKTVRNSVEGTFKPATKAVADAYTTHIEATFNAVAQGTVDTFTEATSSVARTLGVETDISFNSSATTIQKTWRGKQARRKSTENRKIHRDGGFGDVLEAVGDAMVDAAAAVIGNDWRSDPRPPDEEIEERTPEHRWWTPERGWDDKTQGWDYKKKPPKNVMPPACERPSLYPESDDVIGELRVEVLEAEGLTGDAFSAADGYALLVFEGCVATTNVVWNQGDPAWSSKASYRAFIFPVLHPHSTLCIALMESDAHETAGLIRHFDNDDVLGRVTIRLGSLYASTVYDVWYPLGNNSSEYKDYIPGNVAQVSRALEKGVPAIRLRYSIHFHSYQKRTLGYLPPFRGVTPMHEVVFDPECVHNADALRVGAKFALFGPAEPIGEYSWEVLMAHIEEIQLAYALPYPPPRAHLHHPTPTACPPIYPIPTAPALPPAISYTRVKLAVAQFENVLFWRPGYLLYSICLWVGAQVRHLSPQTPP